MARMDYLGWIATLALSAVVVWLILRPIAGERWFGLYGTAVVVLPAAFAFAAVHGRRLAALGRRRWPAYLLTGAIVAAAAVQIGFWATFHALGAKGVVLGVARGLFIEQAGPWLPVVAAGLLVLVGAMVWRAQRDAA